MQIELTGKTKVRGVVCALFATAALLPACRQMVTTAPISQKTSAILALDGIARGFAEMENFSDLSMADFTSCTSIQQVWRLAENENSLEKYGNRRAWHYFDHQANVNYDYVVFPKPANMQAESAVFIATPRSFDGKRIVMFYSLEISELDELEYLRRIQLQM